MELDDLPTVQAIEHASFTTPWPPHAYRSEIETNRLAEYIVARAGAEVVAYAGMWLMVDEAHITTIGVRPRFRGRGYGELLLVTLTEAALDINARWLTLEVRISNAAAQNLYRKYGFHDAGTRKRYYTDNNEDALIMWTDELHSHTFQERYEQLKERLMARLESAGEVEVHEPS
jgi:[ribosomal protein S18]-alanine N-acetyltransferase